MTLFKRLTNRNNEQAERSSATKKEIQKSSYNHALVERLISLEEETFSVTNSSGASESKSKTDPFSSLTESSSGIIKKEIQSYRSQSIRDTDLSTKKPGITEGILFSEEDFRSHPEAVIPENKPKLETVFSGSIFKLAKRILESNYYNLSHLKMSWDDHQKKDFMDSFYAKIESILKNERVPDATVEELKPVLLNEILGFGPIENLMNDRDISSIYIYSFYNIAIEKNGKIETSSLRFESEEHLNFILKNVLKSIEFSDSANQNLQKYYLPDGTRITCVYPPLSKKGLTLSIKKAIKHNFSLEEFIQKGAISEQMVEFLKFCVLNKLNVWIYGGAQSGKTSLLNALCATIPDSERVVLIENFPQIQTLPHHSLRLKTQQYEKSGPFSISNLIQDMMNFVPNRIIVGESCLEASRKLLQLSLSGYFGSLTTIPYLDERQFIEELIHYSDKNKVPISKNQIYENIHILVQMVQLPSGERKVNAIKEIVLNHDSNIEIKNIFSLYQHLDEKEKNAFHFHAQGLSNDMIKRFFRMSIDIPYYLFISNK